MVLAEEAATRAKALGPMWPMREHGRDRGSQGQRGPCRLPLGKLCLCPKCNRGLSGVEARKHNLFRHLRRAHLSAALLSHQQRSGGPAVLLQDPSSPSSPRHHALPTPQRSTCVLPQPALLPAVFLSRDPWDPVYLTSQLVSSPRRKVPQSQRLCFPGAPRQG